jgi:hypothetical protein
MSEQLTITITPTGIKIDAAGYTGNKCVVEQDALEKFLIQTAGVSTRNKDQKRKLEVSYSKTPGNTARY